MSITEIDVDKEFNQFRDSLREKMEAAETPPETPPEPAQERPRDDKGRFVPAATEEPVELIAGKFKTQEDLLKSYQELERRLGEQGAELGNLHQLEDKIAALENRANQPVSPTWDSRTQTTFDRLLEENPGQAANLALSRGDANMYEYALGVWGEADPFNAARFDSALRHQQALQDQEARLREELSPRIQTLTQKDQQEEVVRAYASVRNRHPDLNDYGDQLMETAKQVPEVLVALRTGNQADAERMFETLYWIAKGRNSDTLEQAAREVVREQAQETKQAKVQATVATTSSIPAEEDKSVEQQFKERLLAASGPSVSKGWGRRS